MFGLRLGPVVDIAEAQRAGVEAVPARLRRRGNHPAVQLRGLPTVTSKPTLPAKIPLYFCTES